MKAISLVSGRQLSLVNHDELKTLPVDGVEIDVVLSGICGTDLAVLSGREEGQLGIVRGHEAVGVVVNVGTGVTRTHIGMRVVIDPNEYCGHCEYCTSAKTHLCNGGMGAGLDIAGVNKHGTFAERFVTRERFVHGIPDDMNWETAVLIEPVACILNNIEQASIKAGERVLLLGSGPMSLVAQILLRAIGVHTRATDLNTFRIEFGRSLGLDIVLPEALERHGQVPEKFDVVIDTVGNQLEIAASRINRGGRIVLFGFNGNYQYSLAVKHFLVNAISIIAAGEYNQHFPLALRMAHRLPELGKLVTHRYPLEAHPTAFDRLLNDPCAPMIKSVFTPNLKYLSR
ncbi:alcohol dehydrogenase catalytic domain-containing protein [Pseudomonas citrulli]|uniref:Alcohol dehydrogenase catalytic domain-containing protein n=1 Tax=Pseudomonas citrulli TaxID=3064347 RepID=A0ABT9C0K0_9PSED|nr:alcohol dehydrogenase catalytic domain-containing protein [Pseudomonas sp. K18]MDO7897971.1 alcohol dehydrogenase catalytic domain-containing protein [Pseudomonas sp. K18]